MLRLFLLTILAFHSVSGQSQTCQAGWTLLAGSCYGYGEEAVSWFEAATICAVHGGKLAEIETSEENDIVKSLARSKGDKYVWIGGHDIFKEGNMRWVSPKTSQIIFTDYLASPLQPDDFGGEDCLLLYGPSDYKWADYKCKAVGKFICEGRPSPTDCDG